MSTVEGVRWNTSKAFLRPAMRRPNLRVLTNAQVHRLMLDGKRVTGVEFYQGGEVVSAEAAVETVLAAGAIVARKMAAGEGTLEASMVKAYVCRAGEWVTREAMQLHGGMGYAEEFPVSRYFVDARVLSIFEGADETLCLRVIARRLAEQAMA